MSQAAFRDITIIIGRYLRIGISEHTTRKHVELHLARLREVMTAKLSSRILETFAIERLSYDKRDNAFYLPTYIGSKEGPRLKYYLNGDPKDADIVIPLGDGTDVMVRVEGRPKQDTRVTKHDLLVFMAVIETSSIDRQPQRYSAEEQFLEFTIPQLRSMCNFEINDGSLAILVRRANYQWKKLGSDRRVRVDADTKVVRAYFAQPSKPEPPDIGSDEPEVSFEDIVTEHYSGKASIRGLDIGAGTGTKTGWVCRMLQKSFRDVAFEGIEAEGEFVKIAGKRGNPVKEVNARDLISAYGERSQDLITMFYPYPENIPEFVGIAKKLIGPDGMIAISLQDDDLNALLEDRDMYGGVRAGIVRRALADFTMVKVRAEDAGQAGISVFGKDSRLFVYTPPSRGSGSSFAKNTATEPYIENAAAQMIEKSLASKLPAGSRVLDLMSGAFSYVPDSVNAAEVVGIGLNTEEMRINKRLTRYLELDLNKNPELPSEFEGYFDAVVMTNGAAYVKDPGRFFAAAARSLKPGGILFVAQNPLYYNGEATRAWKDAREGERARLVTDSLRASGVFSDITHKRKQYPGMFGVAQDLDIIVARKPFSSSGTAGIGTGGRTPGDVSFLVETVKNVKSSAVPDEFCHHLSCKIVNALKEEGIDAWVYEIKGHSYVIAKVSGNDYVVDSTPVGLWPARMYEVALRAKTDKDIIAPPDNLTGWPKYVVAPLDRVSDIYTGSPIDGEMFEAIIRDSEKIKGKSGRVRAGAEFKKPSEFSTIFFDIGDVLLRTNNKRVVHALAGYCDMPEDAISAAIIVTKNPDKLLFEKGLITNEEFFRRIRNRLGLRMDYETFVRLYTDKFEVIAENVEIMKALKRAGYRIGIISDIGRISKDHVLSAYREIFSVADVFIASCDVGIMKDDPRIFDIALKASGSEAPKSVFIDDLKSNIGVAESVGMSTVQFVHGKTDLHSSLKSILEPVKKKRSGEAGMAGVAASKAGTRRLLEMLLKNAVAKVSDFSANDGITTGHAAMTQMIPVDFLTDLSRVDVAADPTDPLVRRLIERIENGNLSGNDGRPIRIDVKSDGRVSVFDGMHRIAALKALGVKYIPAMVVYFDRGLIGKIPSKDAPDIFGPYASGHESAGETKPSAEKKPEPTDIATETAASPGDPGGQARLANGGSGPDNIQVAALYEIPAHTSGHFDLFKREVELAVDNRKLGGMLDEKALDILYEMAGNIYRHSRNGYGYLSVESVRRGGDTGMRYTSVNEAPSFSMRDFFVGFSQVQAAWNDADSWHVGLPKMMEFADEFTLKYDSAANRLSISLIKWKTSPGEKSVAILMPMPDASTMRGVSQSIGEVPDYNMNRLDLLSLDKGPIGKIARNLRDGYSHRAAAGQETRNAENAKTGTGRTGSNTAGPASAPDGVDENAKPESPDTSTNVEISSTAMSNTERVQAVELTDAAKLIRNSENPSEIITVGLGTSWMAAYSRNKAEKYQDLNKLIIAIGRLLNHYKINCVAQQAGESDADFAKRIDVNGGRVVVLTGLNTIVRDDSPFAAFRDRRNVFLAGVDTEGAGLDEGCYLPIVEMLKLALYIGLKDMLRQDASSDNIATEPYRKFTNVFRFLPRAVRIPVYENLRQLYLVQEFA